MKYYRTVKEARSALALDNGFDLFVHREFQLGRCTIAKLAELGYIVDRRRAEEANQEHRCETCQVLLNREWDGQEHYWPSHCAVHRKWSRVCDRGHRWQTTDAEDAATNHKCPQCGGYWV